MRRLSHFISIAAWILVAGCGSTKPVYISEARQADTGILEGERIVVLMSRYIREGSEVKDLSSIEKTFEECIRTEMHTVNDKLTFLSAAGLRKLVSADTIGVDGPNPDLVLQSLGESVKARRLAEAKVRYVLLVDASYSTGDHRWSSDLNGWSRWWTQNSSLKAAILDLKHARIAGSIGASSTGNEAAGTFLVVFPFYVNTRTESGACAKLGEALARFISG